VADGSAVLVSNRLFPIRYLDQFECEFLIVEGVPVWRGDKITIDKIGDRIVQSLTGAYEKEPNGPKFGNGDRLRMSLRMLTAQSTRFELRASKGITQRIGMSSGETRPSVFFAAGVGGGVLMLDGVKHGTQLLKRRISGTLSGSGSGAASDSWSNSGIASNLRNAGL
jgi:hypothetical protein